MKTEQIEYDDPADFDIAKVAELNTAIERTEPETGPYAGLDTKELTRQIRAMNKSGDAATKRSADAIKSSEYALSDAEACYAEAGQLLIEAKARNNGTGESWGDWVFKHCGIKQPRADELIRIGAGVTTVAEVRHATATRVAKHREAKKIAATKSNVTADVTLASPEPAAPPTIPAVAPPVIETRADDAPAAAMPAEDMERVRLEAYQSGQRSAGSYGNGYRAGCKGYEYGHRVKKSDPFDEIGVVFDRIERDFITVAELVKEVSIPSAEYGADALEELHYAIKESRDEATAAMAKYHAVLNDLLLCYSETPANIARADAKHAATQAAWAAEREAQKAKAARKEEKAAEAIARAERKAAKEEKAAAKEERKAQHEAGRVEFNEIRDEYLRAIEDPEVIAFAKEKKIKFPVSGLAISFSGATKQQSGTITRLKTADLLATWSRIDGKIEITLKDFSKPSATSLEATETPTPVDEPEWGAKEAAAEAPAPDEPETDLTGDDDELPQPESAWMRNLYGNENSSADEVVAK
jgi:hypothetical protein